jgi:outer membrane lipoprotein SlyB
LAPDLVFRIPPLKNMSTTHKILATLAMGSLGLIGCTSNPRMPVYDSSQVGAVIKSQNGEIISVRDVMIKAQSSAAGSTGMGSRIGAAAGRGAIYGGASAAANAASAVVGEAVGAVAGARADDRVGEEITVSIEGGQAITIVQERSSPPLAPGERVRVVTGSGGGLYGGGGTRVVRDDDVSASSPASERPR